MCVHHYMYVCVISMCVCVSLSVRVSPSLSVCAWRETGIFWCLLPVWNLRAVIWSHLSICSLAILPSPVVAHSIFSFFLLLAHSPAYFPDISFLVCLEIGFFVFPLLLDGFFSGWERICWSMVSVACYLMALVLAIYMHLDTSFLISWWCLVMWVFLTCFCKLVLIN